MYELIEFIKSSVENGGTSKLSKAQKCMLALKAISVQKSGIFDSMMSLTAPFAVFQP